MNILKAVKHAFKNIDKLSIVFIYIGLEFTLGLIIASLIFTLLEGHYGDYVFMICIAKGSFDAALSCGTLSLVAAFICDIAVKDKVNNVNTK